MDDFMSWLVGFASLYIGWKILIWICYTPREPEKMHGVYSTKCRHVMWFPDGVEVEGMEIREGWYWFDEAGLLGCVDPYETEEEAIDSLERYAREILGH
jgi:hypothetical protein